MKKLALNLLFVLFTVPVVFAQQSDSSAHETTLIFVRHAEKSDDGTKDPSLNNKGEERAIRLAELLIKNHDVSAIYSTPYKRTKETSKPISERLNLPINEYQLNNPDSLISALIKSYKGREVLILGHSNTTPHLVNLALKESKYEKLDETDFSNIFVVKVDGSGKAVVQRYTY